MEEVYCHIPSVWDWGRVGGGGYQILSENKVGSEWDIRFLKYHILIISSYQLCFQRLYMNTLFLDQKKTISFDNHLISIYLISVRRYPGGKTQGYQFVGVCVCVCNIYHLTYTFKTIKRIIWNLYVYTLPYISSHSMLVHKVHFLLVYIGQVMQIK